MDIDGQEAETKTIRKPYVINGGYYFILAECDTDVILHREILH